MQSILTICFELDKRRQLDAWMSESLESSLRSLKSQKQVQEAQRSESEDGASDSEDDAASYNADLDAQKDKPKEHHPQIELIKLLFKQISLEDRMDLKIYRALAPDMQEVVKQIFIKRYNKQLVQKIDASKEEEWISTYEYLQLKRVDHCEKSSMSLKLGILKERFIAQEYGRKRPKDLKEDINKAIFRRYFDARMDGEEPMEICKTDSIRRSNKDVPESLPRRSAIFCMKKGLTKCWFRSISSRFLKELMDIKIEEVKKYYFQRFLIKLDEIFGYTGPLEQYHQVMVKKIHNKKFKLPLTAKELDLCDAKAVKKISKLKKMTDEFEEKDFRDIYGKELCQEMLRKYRDAEQSTADHSLSAS